MPLKRVKPLPKCYARSQGRDPDHIRMRGPKMMLDERVCWYISRNGAISGPVTYGQLAQLLVRSEVDYAWCDGLSDWEPAASALSRKRLREHAQSRHGDTGQKEITYTVIEGSSVKLATIVWFVVGVLIPLWPASLPFCWYRACRSYKRPTCRSFALKLI